MPVIPHAWGTPTPHACPIDAPHAWGTKALTSRATGPCRAGGGEQQHKVRK